MRVSIGIFAYNEAGTITDTIRSLSDQDLIRDPPRWVDAVEIICLPNGCTDNTAELARGALAAMRQGSPGVTCQVFELDEPSKSNAWGHFVHEVSERKADFLISMDADIRFLESSCLSALVGALRTNQQASVSVDSIMKDVRLESRTSVFGWISSGLWKLSQTGDPAIAGSLFCGRADVLRRIHLPIGLTRVMDGFIKAMVVTNMFTSAASPDRVIRVPGVAHVFESYRGIGRILRHQTRLAVGVATNRILFAYLWEHATSRCDAGELIRRRNAEEPGWFDALIHEHVKTHGWRIMSIAPAMRPFRELRRLGVRGWPLLPVALTRSMCKAIVEVAALQALRRGDRRW